MKCIIPGSNIKIFARAIHSLSKIGDELYVEPSDQGISFRTVNSSRSAFASFNFRSNFFSFFESSSIPQNSDNHVKCKVAMKACINAFKSVANIERSVEKCKLSMHPGDDKLVVNLYCKHGISKTYNLSFIECETLEAIFDKSSCPFGITSQSRVLCDSVVNFSSNQEEVTLSVSPVKAIIKSHVDESLDLSSTIYTELTLEAVEFDQFNVNSQCDVTFCLKELRALLSFSEPLTLPICLSFSKPGSPLILSLANPVLFEANFVLATLANQSCSQVSSHVSLSSNKKKSLKRSSEQIEESNFHKSVLRHASETITTDASNLERSHCHKLDSKVASPVSSIASPLSISKSRVLPRPNQEKIRMNQLKNGEAEIDLDGEEDFLPSTPPPAKKSNFYFRRCFEPTFNSEQISGRNIILAEDSDPDDDT